MAVRQRAQHNWVAGVNPSHGSRLGDGLRWVKVGCTWRKGNKRSGGPSGAGCCWAKAEPRAGAARTG
jgi:hypothetical protein